MSGRKLFVLRSLLLKWGRDMHLKFGLFIDPLFIAASYPVCEQQALEAERLGFDAVWVSDHFNSCCTRYSYYHYSIREPRCM
jgi:alkanesulfonate monooxygenase SsuD/methylene tetrahydromethanopterin reductase-like flavin-dependent oxidoreductase (luciferase family)